VPATVLEGARGATTGLRQMLEQLDPPTTDIETAASILGIGHTKTYELAEAGDFPVKVVRVGRRYVVPVPAILRTLEAI
jgi:hypothetical protein